METVQELALQSARDAASESNPSRADVSWKRPPREKSLPATARDLLGITAAFSLLPLLYPEGWSRHPELASGLHVNGDDRAWRAGRLGGDVLGLVEVVGGVPNGLAAAQLIVDLIGSLPQADRDQYRPVPTVALPASFPPMLGLDHQESPLSDTPRGGGRLPLPEIEDAADFLAKDLPAPVELVHGILHQGSKMIFAGGSKVGKTWMALDLGLSVAYGREWLGFPTQQGAVLYLNLEIQDAFFRHRIRTVAEAKSIVIAPGRLSIMNLRGHAADLSKLLPELLTTISTRKCALIVVDPIYKVLGGRDENDAGHIAGLLNDLERLAVETGAAVVFAAHYSKGNQAGKASVDRMSGSGVFARDPDTILALTNHEEANAFTVEATLRNHPPLEPFVVRWKYPLMERDNDLNPSKLKQVGGRAKMHTAGDMMKVLGERELSFSAWKAAACKAGISETTFKALRKELKDSGQVCQSEETGAYHKAAKGGKGS